jgi:hypothetical protein
MKKQITTQTKLIFTVDEVKEALKEKFGIEGNMSIWDFYYHDYPYQIVGGTRREPDVTLTRKG